jgi:urea transport system substrate-binding protein
MRPNSAIRASRVGRHRAPRCAGLPTRAERFVPPVQPGSTLRVALCVPFRGLEGIWGPSCIAAGELAAAELNAGRGILGRPCELVLVDGSESASAIGQTLSDLLEMREVDALVGMHLSSVRQRITAAVGGRLPYVYPCLYEGGDTTPGLFAIGETAPRQLRPSIAWLSEHRKCRRWMLLGNDYVWPRVSHSIARRCIAESNGEVIEEVFVPFDTQDYSWVFDRLSSARCDAVLVSIVGQDAVDFNRAFARAGLQHSVLRLSCAIEENQLLAIGAQSTEDLHVALGYFGVLDTDANGAFKERYHSYFGERAPTLNSIGQSVYEGMHFLAALLDDRNAAQHSRHARAARQLVYPSARVSTRSGGDVDLAPMYLARAEGHSFRVIAQL